MSYSYYCPPLISHPCSFQHLKKNCDWMHLRNVDNKLLTLPERIQSQRTSIIVILSVISVMVWYVVWMAVCVQSQLTPITASVSRQPLWTPSATRSTQSHSTTSRQHWSTGSSGRSSKSSLSLSLSLYLYSQCWNKVLLNILIIC